MKKIFILLLFVVNLALGQSVTITPADASQTTIRKFGGTATLKIVGAGDSGFGTGTTGNSEISLFNMTYLGASATSSIKFNNVYSIKNTYTPNLAGEENTFGMFYNTTPFFAFNPYSTVLETVPISVSHTASNTLSLANSTALGNNVKNEIFFKTGSYYTGAIKTIGTSASFARMGFFTFTDQSSNNLVERLSIIDGGNVGIGTTTPQTALHVVGNIRSSNLAGTGNRPVYADANGTFTTTANTTYENISLFEFRDLDGNNLKYISGIGSYTGGSAEFIAPLHFSHGRKITGFTVYFTDSHATYNLSFVLFKNNINDFNVFNIVANLTSSGTPGNSSLTVSGLNETIDNINNSYSLWVSPSGAGSIWTNTIGIKSVVFTIQ